MKDRRHHENGPSESPKGLSPGPFWARSRLGEGQDVSDCQEEVSMAAKKKAKKAKKKSKAKKKAPAKKKGSKKK